MDKNMINIDDLFRQKLVGADESERPGSWMQMRELLDKEMPVQAPGNTLNWRRMFGLVAGMLIVVAASVGGYNAMTSFRSADSKEMAAANPEATGTGTNRETGTPSTVNSTDSKTVVAEKGQQTTTTGNNNNANNAGNKAIASTAGKTEKAKPNVTKQQANTSANTTPVAANTQKATEKVAQKASVATTNDNKSAAPEVAAKANESADFDGKKLNNNNLNNNTAIAASNNKQTKQAAGKTAATVAVNDKLSSGNNTPTAKPAVANKPAANNATGNNTNQSAKTEVAKNENTVNKQMLDKVQTKESYDRKAGAWKQDTIDKGKMEWAAKEEPAVAMTTKANTNTEILPASAATASNKEQMLPLSEFKTSSKKQNYETKNVFEEMVKNAKMQLGGVKFYPGLLLGLNYSFSSTNPMGGFQGGVTGTLSLNEKWGIVSELKFTQRFKDGSKESHNGTFLLYENVDHSNNTYSWDAVDHYFTYPSVSSIDMPVMLRHSHNRINLMLGANFTYYFGFSPGETQKHNIVNNSPTPFGGSVSEGAILRPADFASRFGIGYTGGVGYQLSPAWQVDARLTQSVWTNSSAAGEKKASKEVFQLPSLQFNFSYRFSSNKYKPYRQH